MIFLFLFSEKSSFIPLIETPLMSCFFILLCFVFCKRQGTTFKKNLQLAVGLLLFLLENNKSTSVEIKSFNDFHRCDVTTDPRI